MPAREPAAIAGYMGKSEALDDAIASFAMAYADQTNTDYAALVKAKGATKAPAKANGRTAKKPPDHVGQNLGWFVRVWDPIVRHYAPRAPADLEVPTLGAVASPFLLGTSNRTAAPE